MSWPTCTPDPEGNYFRLYHEGQWWIVSNGVDQECVPCWKVILESDPNIKGEGITYMDAIEEAMHAQA